MEDQPETSNRALEAAYSLVNRIIGLLYLVLSFGFFGFLMVLGSYLWLVLTAPADHPPSETVALIGALMQPLLEKLGPVAHAIVAVVAPVVIILLAIVALHVLSKQGATPFDFSKITSDLPSVLALIIIITICLLPLAGLEVPGVLNNIALVVVGFYFGKRESGSV